MTEMTLMLLVAGLVLAVVALGVFAYAARQGQFDDLEEVKFQMFREETR